MRIQGYDVARAQRGWVCDTFFAVLTARQLTGEGHRVRTGGRWVWLAMFRGRRAARRLARSLAAKPGEREAKGWR